MNSKTIELFEQYCSNELSENDRLVFEKRLESEANLKKDFMAFIEVKESLNHANNKRLKDKVKLSLEKIEQKEYQRERRPMYLTAASVLVICCLSFYVYMNSSKTDTLYSKYYTPYSETTSVLSSNNSSLEECLNEYNQEAYQRALDCFSELSPNSEMYFYLGMCYANLEDTKLAIKSLVKVEELGANFLEETNWYLALLYLKQDNLNEVKERLGQVLNRPNSNYKKMSAEQLLSKLDE
jgi:tetratricopeptide (TPR) repeat protein